MNHPNFTKVTVIDGTGSENILENIGDPTSVEWVVIEDTREGYKFKLHKKELGELSWRKAINAAAGRIAGGRIGTRHELICVFNAVKTAGLNDLLKAVGGDTIAPYWHWTEEEYDDPQYSATYAWYVGLLNGNVYRGTKTRGYQVRLISAF